MSSFFHILTTLNTSLMYNRGNSNHEVSLPQHLWMLRKILTVDLSIVDTSGQQSDAEQWVEHLLRYIIATCYPKILQHLTNQLSVIFSFLAITVGINNFFSETQGSSHPNVDGTCKQPSPCPFYYIFDSPHPRISWYHHSGKLSSQRKGHLLLH